MSPFKGFLPSWTNTMCFSSHSSGNRCNPKFPIWIAFSVYEVLICFFKLLFLDPMYSQISQLSVFFPSINRHNVLRHKSSSYSFQLCIASFIHDLMQCLFICLFYFFSTNEGTPSNPDAGNINVAIPNYDGSRNSFRCCICFCCPSHGVRTLFQFISHCVK